MSCHFEKNWSTNISDGFIIIGWMKWLSENACKGRRKLDDGEGVSYLPQQTRKELAAEASVELTDNGKELDENYNF